MNKRNQNIHHTIARAATAAQNYTPSQKELTQEPQAARTSSDGLLNYNSVTTVDPTRLAAAFQQADSGYIHDQAVLFNLIEEQDSHIFAELGKRRRAVTGLGWQINPPRDANQSELDRCDELTDIFNEMKGFEDAQYDLTDAVGKGLSALEMQWQTGDLWLPKTLEFVPQHKFKSTLQGGLQLYQNGITQDLRPYGWVVHKHVAKSGYIEQAALFRVLAWTYAYKAYDTKDMQKFLERYGIPLRLGKFPMGTPKDMQATLLKAVRNIGSDGAGVVPNTMTIDFLESKIGKVGDFLDAVNYWERKQSMAILGGTLTSQADGKTSTNALGEIHNEVRREIMLHDVRQIVPTINQQLLQPIIAFNGMFKADRMPKFGYQTQETVDQDKMVKVLKTAAEIGMRISLDYAHEITQIPQAADDEAVLTVGIAAPKSVEPVETEPTETKPAPTDKADTTAKAALNLPPNLGGNEGGNNYTPEFIAQQLTQLAAQHEQSLIDEIGAAVANAGGDFNAAIDEIEALTIQHTQTQNKFAALIGNGLTAAHLAGRVDLNEGN